MDTIVSFVAHTFGLTGFSKYVATVVFVSTMVGGTIILIMSNFR